MTPRDQTPKENSPIIASPVRRWALIAGAYFIAAVFFGGQRLLGYLGRGQPVPLGQVVGSEFVYWAIWLGLTPWILAFSRRFRIEAPQRGANISAHLLFALIVAVAQIGLWKSLDLVLYGGLSLRELVRGPSELRYAVLVGAWTSYYKYWIIVGIEHGLELYRRYRDREREAARLQIRSARLEAEMTQIQLDALRKQLHPHFLFNTMNTISVLMEEDVARARRMLLHLSELLRVTLEHQGAHEVPLRQDLDFLRRYLEIEQVRFNGRLTVRMEIDQETLDARVPTLILQPLVENAIRHGIAPRAAAGRISIRASRQRDELYLEVEDDGPGLTTRNPSGIGLSNTRSRLAQLYAGDARLELGRTSGGCTLALVVVPYRQEEHDGEG